MSYIIYNMKTKSQTVFYTEKRFSHEWVSLDSSSAIKFFSITDHIDRYRFQQQKFYTDIMNRQFLWKYIAKSQQVLYNAKLLGKTNVLRYESYNIFWHINFNDQIKTSWGYIQHRLAMYKDVCPDDLSHLKCNNKSIL